MSAPLTKSELQERALSSPFIRFLSPEVTQVNVAEGTLSMAISMRPEFERLAGSNQFHGGIIAALIDTVGDYALIAQIGAGIPTINFSTDFLRPAMGPRLVAVARIRRNGRTVGVVDIDVLDAEGKIVAVGRGCYATNVSKS